jgi:hypothetical protein
MRIVLNVGGTMFETMKDTLLKSAYFEAFFRFENNDYFIDRDPEMFRHVLNLLRDPDYNFPKEYISELDFYGVDRIYKPKKLISHKDQDFYKQNVNSMTPYIQGGNSSYTLHLSFFKKTTHILYSTSGRYFEGDWSYVIKDVVSKIFILIPDTISLEKLRYFDITLKVGQYERKLNLYYITLNGASYDTKYIKIETFDSFHHIPLCLLESCNHGFFNCVKNVEISLHSEKYNVQTGLKYFSSDLQTEEKHQLVSSHIQFLINDVTEYDFSGKSFELKGEAIRYIIWNINKDIDSVKLIKDDKKQIFSKGEFQHLERIKVGLEHLKDNSGAIYFCLGAYNMTINSGCIFQNENNYLLEFPEEVSGKIWVTSYYILDYK